MIYRRDSIGIIIVYYLGVLYRKRAQFVNSRRTDRAGITGLSLSYVRWSLALDLESGRKAGYCDGVEA